MDMFDLPQQNPVEGFDASYFTQQYLPSDSNNTLGMPSVGPTPKNFDANAFCQREG